MPAPRKTWPKQPATATLPTTTRLLICLGKGSSVVTSSTTTVARRWPRSRTDQVGYLNTRESRMLGWQRIRNPFATKMLRHYRCAVNSFLEPQQVKDDDEQQLNGTVNYWSHSAHPTTLMEAHLTITYKQRSAGEKILYYMATCTCKLFDETWKRNFSSNLLRAQFCFYIHKHKTHSPNCQLTIWVCQVLFEQFTVAVVLLLCHIRWIRNKNLVLVEMRMVSRYYAWLPQYSFPRPRFAGKTHAAEHKEALFVLLGHNPTFLQLDLWIWDNRQENVLVHSVFDRLDLRYQRPESYATWLSLVVCTVNKHKFAI